ncbi:MAG: addiction module protein [Candidatus Thiosymbion ectosymbiont of Robbea hypermnestra]|nr:addiction module protein [Candidatus Thiosymbion ectosymbiont of Robbea hypermnestra]
MSLPERLRTMEALWDSLSHDDAQIPSPDWHGDTLSERKKKITEGTAQFLSIREISPKKIS